MEIFRGIDVAGILIQFVVLLFALSIHEASHAWMADWCGDYTARYLGRVTLNPIAHMDPIGTLLFPLLQFFTGFPLIGWAKPVPVNQLHFRKPHRDQILVSLAGPVANLLAAGAAFVLLVVLKWTSPLADGLLINMIGTMQIPRQNTILVPILGLLFFTLVINLALALFNALPIPPLDGHWVLYALLPHDAARVLERVGSYGIFILYALMIFGMFQFIFWPIRVLLGLLLSL